jgi:anti-sigma B factor antagonist
VLILDLSGVPYLDSMGVGALVHACVSCRRSGRHLALAGLNSRVATVLKITGVEPVFDIFPSAADAEASL